MTAPLTLGNLPKCSTFLMHDGDGNRSILEVMNGHHGKDEKTIAGEEAGRFLTEAQAAEYLALKAENRRLREALGKYADQDNWDCGEIANVIGGYDSLWFGEDAYKIARAALEKKTDEK